MVSQTKMPASDRQARLKARRTVPLSRRQQNERDAQVAAQIAAEALADIRSARLNPDPPGPEPSFCDECGVEGGRHHPDCDLAPIDGSLDAPERTGDNALLIDGKGNDEPDKSETRPPNDTGEG